MKNISIIALCLISASAAAQGNVLTISGGAAVAPRYLGSDKDQPLPLAIIDYQMANGFFFSSMRGIGYAESLGSLQFSSALGYRGERSESKRYGFGGSRGDAALRGMGDVEGSPTALVGVTLKLPARFALNARFETPLTRRENGDAGSIGLSSVLVDGRKNHLMVSAVASAGDGKFMQTYFGVTSSQAARSRHARFTPKRGIYQGELSVVWVHHIDQRWSVSTTLAASSLAGDARLSPLARRTTAPSGALYASYRY